MERGQGGREGGGREGGCEHGASYKNLVQTPTSCAQRLFQENYSTFSHV